MYALRAPHARKWAYALYRTAEVDTLDIKEIATVGGVTIDNLGKFNGDVIIGDQQGDTLTVYAATSFRTQLDVTGDMDVTGAATFSLAPTFEDAVNVNGAMTVGGAATMNTSLAVLGDVFADDADLATVTTSGNATVGGALAVTGNATVAGTLDVTGNFSGANSSLALRTKYSGTPRTHVVLGGYSEPDPLPNAYFFLRGETDQARISVAGGTDSHMLLQPLGAGKVKLLSDTEVTGALTVTGAATMNTSLAVLGDIFGDDADLATVTTSGDANVGGFATGGQVRATLGSYHTGSVYMNFFGPDGRRMLQCYKADDSLDSPHPILQARTYAAVLGVSGGTANEDLHIDARGTGEIQVKGPLVAESGLAVTGDETVSGSLYCSYLRPNAAHGGDLTLHCGNGRRLLIGGSHVGDSSYLYISNAVGRANLAGYGTDTNIDLRLQPKGTGIVDVQGSLTSTVTIEGQTIRSSQVFEATGSHEAWLLGTRGINIMTTRQVDATVVPLFVAKNAAAKIVSWLQGTGTSGNLELEAGGSIDLLSDTNVAGDLVATGDLTATGDVIGHVVRANKAFEAVGSHEAWLQGTRGTNLITTRTDDATVLPLLSSKNGSMRLVSWTPGTGTSGNLEILAGGAIELMSDTNVTGDVVTTGDVTTTKLIGTTAYTPIHSTTGLQASMGSAVAGDSYLLLSAENSNAKLSVQSFTQTDAHMRLVARGTGTIKAESPLAANDGLTVTGDLTTSGTGTFNVLDATTGTFQASSDVWLDFRTSTGHRAFQALQNEDASTPYVLLQSHSSGCSVKAYGGGTDEDLNLYGKGSGKVVSGSVFEMPAGVSGRISAYSPSRDNRISMQAFDGDGTDLHLWAWSDSYASANMRIYCEGSGVVKVESPMEVTGAVTGSNVFVPEEIVSVSKVFSNRETCRFSFPTSASGTYTCSAICGNMATPCYFAVQDASTADEISLKAYTGTTAQDWDGTVDVHLTVFVNGVSRFYYVGSPNLPV